MGLIIAQFHEQDHSANRSGAVIYLVSFFAGGRNGADNEIVWILEAVLVTAYYKLLCSEYGHEVLLFHADQCTELAVLGKGDGTVSSNSTQLRMGVASRAV